MTIKEAFDFVVNQLYKKSSCGRLSLEERNAIRILRQYLNNEN